MGTDRRTAEQCLAEAQRAEAEARLMSLESHREQLLAIADEWRSLALEASLREAAEALAAQDA